MGKGIIRIVTTTLFIITLLVFVGAVVISMGKTNGLTSWAENPSEITALLGSFIVLLLINIVRLRLGVTMVLTKKNVQHQYIFLLFFSLVLFSFCLLTIHAYMFAAICLVTGFAGGAIIKQRMWRIFTEIRETDRAVFKARLIKSGLLIGALTVLTFFDSSNSSYMLKLMYAIYYGYLISSFFIGFVVVRHYFSPVANAVSDWESSEQKQEDDVTRREQENNEIHRATTGITPAPMVAPKSDLAFAKFAGILVFLSICISGMVVGVFMIPFYLYVLSTKKVTVLELVTA